ncbi:unnamed protein product [Schistocephalus solidus]|uniref:Secreted protein n=1 Tax=Schistocephalus solidus TaxID=70667 RepID=A0A183T1Z6_SCHSO|nr:unnamed protein product [Schistocephalus solidus]
MYRWLVGCDSSLSASCSPQTSADESDAPKTRRFHLPTPPPTHTHTEKSDLLLLLFRWGGGKTAPAGKLPFPFATTEIINQCLGDCGVTIWRLGPSWTLTCLPGDGLHSRMPQLSSFYIITRHYAAVYEGSGLDKTGRACPMN